MKDTFKITKTPYDLSFSVKYDSEHVCQIVPDFTDNCQMGCIKRTEDLLQYVTSEFAGWDYDDAYSKKEVKVFLKKFFRKLFNEYGKFLWLMDVNIEDGDREYFIDNYFGEDNIVMKSPYISTNGSEMCVYIVNIGKKLNEIIN